MSTGTFFDLDPESWVMYVDHDEERKVLEEDYEAEEACATTVKDSELYWTWCILMLYAWGLYVAKQDLWDNVNDPEKKHKVWHVVVSHFGGKPMRLENRKNEVFNDFLDAYSKYRAVCDDYGVEAVDRKWLRSHLWDGEDIDSYRKRCKTRQGNAWKYPAKSLKDFSPRKSKK